MKLPNNEKMKTRNICAISAEKRLEEGSPHMTYKHKESCH